MVGSEGALLSFVMVEHTQGGRRQDYEPQGEIRCSHTPERI